MMSLDYNLLVLYGEKITHSPVNSAWFFSGLGVGLIIGIAVGGLCALLLTTTLLMLFIARRRNVTLRSMLFSKNGGNILDE